MPDLSSLEMNLARRLNIGDIPKRSAARHPGRTALVYQDRRITYKEFNDSCCRMAHALEALGAQQGDRIACSTSMPGWAPARSAAWPPP
jgi:acyl-CoA synthetase (AMP-forming)/AMP-acid ligase II